MRELPVAGWAPRTTNDTGVATEVVREKVGGEVRDCLRITWTKPTRDKQRYAVVKVPFAVDVQAFDLKALREAGVTFYGQETEFLEGSVPEMWVAGRKLYMPDWDVDAIRAYYCSRVFGAAAEDLYDFYAKIRVLRYSECRDTEFEETGWSELGELALRTPSKGHANLGEELDALLHRAEKKTRGDARAHFHVGRILEFWDWYFANAHKALD